MFSKITRNTHKHTYTHSDIDRQKDRQKNTGRLSAQTNGISIITSFIEREAKGRTSYNSHCIRCARNVNFLLRKRFPLHAILCRTTFCRTTLIPWRRGSWPHCQADNFKGSPEQRVKIGGDPVIRGAVAEFRRDFENPTNLCERQFGELKNIRFSFPSPDFL